VSFEQVVLRSHAPLAWTRLLVLDERGSRLSASLASRLRCPHPPPAEVTAIHLRDAVRLTRYLRALSFTSRARFCAG